MRIEIITFHMSAPRRYDEIKHYSSREGERKIKIKDPKDRYKYVEDYATAENMKVIQVDISPNGAYVIYHLVGE